MQSTHGVRVDRRQSAGSSYAPTRTEVANRVNLAVVLESLHKISMTADTGLVRLHRLVKRLRKKKPGWSQWSLQPFDFVKDQELIKKKFLEVLLSQNLAHVAGKDTYRPGPEIVPQKDITLTYSEQDKEKMRAKQFHDEPFICLTCYRNANCLDLAGHQFQLSDLLEMLDDKLVDPEPLKKCKCPVDDKGSKTCGGQGNVGTCTETTPTNPQKMRLEQFRLIESWLKLKRLYIGKPEWFQCREAEFGGPPSSERQSRASDAQYQKTQDQVTTVEQATEQRVPEQSRSGLVRSSHVRRTRQKFYLCDDCLRQARAKGTTKDGLSAKEIVLMICDLLTKEEKQEQGRHCVCKTCIDKVDSTVVNCRRTSSDQGSVHSRKIDQNVETIAKWVKDRDRRHSQSQQSRSRIRDKASSRSGKDKERESRELRRRRRERSKSRGRKSSRRSRKSRRSAREPRDTGQGAPQGET